MTRFTTNQHGFTLIEIVVVVGILGLLTVGGVQIMLNSFRAKTSVNLSSKVEAGATYILEQIRQNLINAEGKSVRCISASTVTFRDRDGGSSSVTCASNNIELTTTAGTVRLSEGGVVSVGGCNVFVSCDTSSTSGYVYKVNIGFTLTSSEAASTFERSFKSSVTIRN